MKKNKEPIRLRQKKLQNGNISLYLDIYLDGRRSYEFLKLYLISERTRHDKEQNRQTMQLANAIKARRILELQGGKYDLTHQKRGEVYFIAYMKKLTAERKKNTSEGNYLGWLSVTNHLEAYTRQDFPIIQLTSKWLEGFQRYLDTIVSDKMRTPLKQKTKLLYWRKLKSALNQAVKDGILARNPADGCTPVKNADSERMYLTIEELRKLSSTPCVYPELKQAFLFSCLTGLRFSDVRLLTWGEVYDGESCRIIFRQKKTNGLQYLDITAQARQLMGERKEDDEAVFRLMYNHYTNVHIKEWVRDAGIKKRITFHCARHTFATMMLTLGTDIYTVSKLLGHRDLSATQIYAKIIDEKKRKAVDNIPSIL